MEVELAVQMGWSLYEINETDAEDLLLFMMNFKLPEKAGGASARPHPVVACDQADFLSGARYD